MLKIKDNVDLKELEKFGFEPRYNEITGKIARYIKIDKRNVVNYVNNDHNHSPYWEVILQSNDLLYDLIQARISRKGVEYGN